MTRSEDWLAHQVERLAAQVRASRRPRVDVDAEVARFLAENPAAAANAVARAVHGRRQDVLRAVREQRGRFPDGGNHSDEVAS